MSPTSVGQVSAWSRVGGLALAAAVLLPAAAARADFPWPVNGAPVCAAPGDQTGLMHIEVGCSGGLGITWIDRVASPDSLVMGGVGIEPPTGECSVYWQRFAAAGVRELSGALATSMALGVPGCQPPVACALWLEGSGAQERIALHVPIWYSTGSVVADDGLAPRSHPRMAASGSSGLGDTAMIVVWSDGRGGTPQIRAQRVTWRGERLWGAGGIVIAPTASAQTEPEITRLTDGSVLVVWTDLRAGSDIYAIRLLETGEIAPGWPADGLALESRPELSSSPRLVGQFWSNIFVVWTESGPRFGGGSQIVVRRMRDAGPAGDPDLGKPHPSWTADGVVLSTIGAMIEFGDVQVDGVGGLIAVWADARNAGAGDPSDLYSQRLTAAGTVAAGWPASGLPICTAPGRQGAARLGVHQGGTSVYAWEDERHGPATDIYATLREPDGVLACCEWQTNGLPASTAPGAQTAPVISATNSGGLMVAWTDARAATTSGLDIYAQAFSYDGRNVDVLPGTPPRLMLARPFPNPSRGRTRLALDLPGESSVRLELLDIAGRRVRTLADGVMPQGRQQWVWDGLDDQGRKVHAGMYQVRSTVGGVSQARALIVLD